MKLAVSGKGGVGKTTISALIAMALRDAGKKVIAIDADPDSNLLACMGYPESESVPPLVELKDFIAERTGVKPGTTGGMYKLNPKVDDIPEKYSVDVDGIKVLVAGAVKKGGAGCYCPENSLVRSLLSHLLLDSGSALVLDMEAGVEHLGRATVEAIDHLIIVVNPGRRSIETALRIRKLAGDIGLRNVSFIGNKVGSKEEESALRETLSEFPCAGILALDESLMDAERSGTGLSDVSSNVKDSVESIVKYLEEQAREKE